VSRLGRLLPRTIPLFGLLLGVWGVGCDNEPPRRPNMMHPVDERRAVEIIGHTFQQAQLDAELNHSILVSRTGTTLNLDIVASGHQYGVAYLTRDEAKAVGDVVPKYDPESDQLVVVDGVGESAGWHALVLYDRAYLSDDLEGESHSATTIAAEKKIERDARDFVLKAKNAGWQ
jgi:hypothetical protein